MKQLLLKGVKVIFAGLFAVLILSLFVIVYKYSGTHIENKSGSTDYKWVPGQFRSTMVEGFAWNKVDDNGFNNAYPKGDGIDVLLMGSSHMEGFNVAPDETAAYHLNELLENDGMYCYNIGISGHTLVRCINNMDSANREYKPKAYIVVETDTVAPPADEMQMVLDGSLEKIKSYDSGILYYLQKIPCIKVIFKNFQNLSKQSIDATQPAENTDEKLAESEYEKILNDFLSKAKLSAQNSRLIIVYHPTMLLRDNASVQTNTNKEALSMFEAICRKNNILFVDMTDAFTKEYYANHALPHGFINTNVGRGHLNRLGHRLIAEQVYEVIKECEGAK